MNRQKRMHEFSGEGCMTGIHTVFIAVKRINDGLMQMGLRKDSDEFSIASEVEKRLERLSIQS